MNRRDLLRAGVFAAAAIPFSRLSAQTAPSPLKPGHFKWRPERAPSGPVVLIVSISEQLAYVYRNGIRIGVTTCSTGAPGHRTPTGVFTILQKNADHYSNLYNNAPMPYMQRLTWRGIALHAGDLPGYPASHGCIRLLYEFAQRLFEITKLGTTVIISDKGSAPQEVNNPGLLIPDYARQEAERVVEAEIRNSRKGGWVTKVNEDVRSIVISGADRKAIVILNGKVEAEGAVRVLDTGQPLGTHAFSLLGPSADATIEGALYQRHGTTTATRLLVFDKATAENSAIPASSGHATGLMALFRLVDEGVPPRLKAAQETLSRAMPKTSFAPKPVAKPASAPFAAVALSAESSRGEPVTYQRKNSMEEAAHATDKLYEPYAVQTIAIEGAKPHPTALVQSASMASVAPPMPSYVPRLPRNLVTDGFLSDAQIETIIYAGEAHQSFLAGHYKADDSFDRLDRVAPEAEGAVQFRKGYFLGDGTGCGKGRQAAGILLDNWLQGRRRALWISKSDKLLEDAQRDWSALGQEKLQIVPLTRTKQGQPIKLRQGILFTTYATLRSSDRGGKNSRLQQILDWLGPDFDGVILFDEAHAMANAVGSASARGQQAPSQQGLAGLRLQHALPKARVVYISATGATTVQNLGYAQRLGLWGGTDFPFATRRILCRRSRPAASPPWRCWPAI